MVGALALALLALGAARLLAHQSAATELLSAGTTLLLVMLFGWLGTLIGEGQAGRFDAQAERSFRWGMLWFIVSEVMFFAALFGALFYARALSVPWLGGAGAGASTHLLLWPQFQGDWPLLHTPQPQGFDQPRAAMGASGIPVINTLILLSSAVAVTWAHWGLKRGQRQRAALGLLATLALGGLFLSLQAQEFVHAWGELNLKLSSGIYGSVFYLLTGFHGLHVAVGTVFLAVVLLRLLAGHFSPGSHFAFEAASWYWHFVDAVWLVLFTCVYWI